MKKDIKIIGAGLGGLSAACLLASKGHKVTVLEKNERAGGKINKVRAKGFRFDTGPSLLTMPHILASLFEKCGASLDDYLTLAPLNPICRYFYTDGTIFDSPKNRAEMLDEVKKIAPDQVQNYQDFLKYAAGLFSHTKDAFLFNPLYSLRDLRGLNLIDFLRIDAFSSVANRVDGYFESPHLRQFFKRFSTYNGSSPYQAPATLNVIPHIELSLGGYYVKGGIYQIIEALYRLATEQGVVFHFNSTVKGINVRHGKVHSVETTDGEQLGADLVVSNSDASQTYLNLIQKHEISRVKQRAMRALEPSCSGFVLLLGINRRYHQLRHHNVFFSSDYQKEFAQIFKRKVMPDDPTIYIADTSSKNPDHAIAGGSNLFVLVNAPYLSKQWNWDQKQESYSTFIIQQLEKKGLTGLKEAILYKSDITPVDFKNRYQANRGSIYGTSSNSRWAAFLRPKNKARAIDGLYLVGGSTHPGGGIPLVILSAFHAAALIERYE